MPLTTTMARVKQRTDALKLSMKLPARNIALVACISPAAFSNGLLGVTYLGCEVEAKLSEITLGLQTLEDAVAPLCLPSDPERLRAILDFVKEQHVEADNIRVAIRSLFGVAE
jgi:hypothetical protein